MQLSGKNIIVTGAATGIGRAIAEIFAQNGAALVLADVNDTDLCATASKIVADGSACSSRHADVSCASEVQALVRYAEDKLGGVDVVVNSAGIQRAGSVDEFAEDTWDQVMNVNAKSCFLMAKYCVGPMRTRGRGAIVNIASLAGLKGGPGMTAYSASKGAIVAFSKALSSELAPYGIRVNALCPGWIDTPFNEPAINDMGGVDVQQEMIKNIVPLKRQGTPEEVARAALYLASDSSSYVTGQALVIDGGLL